MTHPPRIRLRGIPPGRWRFYDSEPPRPLRELLARDVVRVAFYLPHDHADIAEGVLNAFECYIRAVGEGPGSINHVYLGGNDEGARLTGEWWGYIRNTLQPQRRWRFPDDYGEVEARRIEERGFQTKLLLTGGANETNGYQFEYRARIPYRDPLPRQVSLLSATLPTEYLLAHGPARVHALVLAMASRLRFATGHAGLALSVYSSLRISDEGFRTELSRYPGIDLRTAWPNAHRMDGRVVSVRPMTCCEAWPGRGGRRTLPGHDEAEREAGVGSRRRGVRGERTDAEGVRGASRNEAQHVAVVGVPA